MQMSHDVTILIESKLEKWPFPQSTPSIFKVEYGNIRLGQRDSTLHPEIVSIGPYHHHNSKLQKMEQLKYTYLKQLLERKKEPSVKSYVSAVKGMEKRARRCYSEPLDLDENQFVMLMLVDGIFLIELLRYSRSKYLRHANDPVFKHEMILSQLRHDILLMENQLPFFVLNQLFEMTKINDDDELSSLALGFVDGFLLNSSVSGVVLKRLHAKNIDHILGLIHEVWCLPFADMLPATGGGKGDFEEWENIHSVSRLKQFGVKFKRKSTRVSFMDITFANGVLKIPQLNIFDETESQLKNLIAYEQFLPDGKPRYASDYAFLMHCLITDSNDVQELRCHGIIGNWLGGDEEVCQMFDRLGRNILISSEFSYIQVFHAVNKHCSRRVEKWKANLRRNYFNSPWSILSVLAAVILLVLTGFQTGYTIGTYYRHR
ncbi:UPF0481 protein At3g47200-like [Henckelia pumila]|uniref:UPF0481 protein At3g47200-like n=1 Tax=Henckelia pumila TaxID=405737 RepID=UPI003C6DD419